MLPLWQPPTFTPLLCLCSYQTCIPSWPSSWVSAYSLKGTIANLALAERPRRRHSSGVTLLILTAGCGRVMTLLISIAPFYLRKNASPRAGKLCKCCSQRAVISPLGLCCQICTHTAHYEVYWGIQGIQNLQRSLLELCS